MPTPLLHSAVGLAAARAGGRARVPWRALALAAAVAALPDLDLLPGLLLGEPLRFHHGPTHSILFAVLVAWAASRLDWGSGVSARRRFGVLLLAALSHTALDLFNFEVAGPYMDVDPGLPLAWPLPWRVWPIAPIFQAAPIAKDPRLWFSGTLLRVVLRELVLGLGIFGLAWRLPWREGAATPADVPVGAPQPPVGAES